MASEGTAQDKDTTAPEPDDERKVDSPSGLTKRSWKYTFSRAVSEFGRDQGTDLAAALTYYSVLAIFPGLVALVSLLGVFGQSRTTTGTLLEILESMGQTDAAQTLRGPIEQMVESSGAGFALVAGLLGALWSASGYVGAFGRAMNRIYEVDEGRPIWKLRPLFLGVTAALTVLVAAVLVGLVVSGPLASAIGDTVGLGQTAQTVFGILKWPVVLGIVVVIVAFLYYFTPNIRQPKIRWVSVGAVVAIGVWAAASALFGLYVSNFGSYNKTYGALAGVIVFLLWLWITNLALLFGAEVDAELERARQLQAGIPAEETLQLPPRDTTKSEKARDKREAIILAGKDIRRDAERSGAGQDSSGADQD